MFFLDFWAVIQIRSLTEHGCPAKLFAVNAWEMQLLLLKYKAQMHAQIVDCASMANTEFGMDSDF